MRGQSVRRRVGAGVLTTSLLLTAVLGACTEDGDKAPGDGGTKGDGGSQGAAPQPGALDLKPGTVTGTLSPAAVQAATTAVGSVVTTWWDAAYLGEHPRKTFGWPAFTQMLLGQARREAAITSNTTMSPYLRDVRPVFRMVRVDLMAPGGRYQAATARFGLRYDATVHRGGGTEQQRQEVWGRLMLVAQGTKWVVVGYDIHRKEQVTTGAAS